MEIIQFVLVRHFGLAGLAAVLFFIGAGLGMAVATRGPRILTRMPLAVLGVVLRALGREPSLQRLILVIFCFNGTAMFLYMASGVRPLIPAMVDLLTGFDIAVILLLAGERMHLGAYQKTRGDWLPGKILAGLCGAAVLLIELPCFWYSIAMGITLGREAAAADPGYGQALLLRGGAYVRLVLPALFLSAVCESVAIRGLEARSQAP